VRPLRRRLAIASVPSAAVAVALVTMLTRLGVVPLRDLAASPPAVAGGREWLLATSAFVADRPALASIAGLVLVGLAALALAGPRVLWAAAIAGHLVSTVAVYGVLDAAGVTVTRLDYGTSAVIASWIGVIAYRLWVRGSAPAAVGLCAVAALVGWLCRPDLDILDTEHAVALAVGVAVAAWAPRLAAAPARLLLVRCRLVLQGRRLRHGSG
jgi:hypothetical protein